MRLLGARVLVTGATGEIGRAVTVALGGQGCRLIVTGRDPDRLQALAAQTGARTIAADLLEPEQRLDVLEQAGDVLDLVVLGAGIGSRAALSAHSVALIRELVELDLTAQIELTRLLLPRLQPGGRLVLIGSVAGRLGVAQESVYAAAKAGLEIFGASVRSELSSTGVGVTVISPGVVGSEFFARRGVPYDRSFPRPVAAERVARAVVRGVRRDRAEVLVPGWLRIPVLIRALAPQTYARLAGRWG